ncbi:MAG: HAD-IB family phosphatase [Candidatus Methanofastidiosia archaeon]|jgi:phosphoserine phosphatase
MKVIFFDLDGVLSSKAHCILMAEMINREENLYNILRKVSNSADNLELEWIIKEVVKLFKNKPESLLKNTGEKLSIMKGAAKTIKILKDNGYTPILVTNGIEQVAGVFARRLNIPEWHGNTVEIKNGKITGRLCASPLVTLHSKGDVVRNIIAQKSSKKTVAVGNDVNDWSMFQETEISILFNPPLNLESHLKWWLDRTKKEFAQGITHSPVNIIIEEPDLRLILPFLVPVTYLEKSEQKIKLLL